MEKELFLSGYCRALDQSRLVEVEIDELGIIPEALEKALKETGAKFLYTIPTFQNPTGRTLPIERRKQVYELCKEYGCIVLEDDPYAALRYEGEPVAGIKSFDATFPARIHAWLEDLTNKVHYEFIRSSGRDALATLEYIEAVIQSYEQGGEMVRPHPLPAIHGTPEYIH